MRRQKSQVRLRRAEIDRRIDSVYRDLLPGETLELSEIAARADVPLNTVKMTLTKALRKLSQSIELREYAE